MTPSRRGAADGPRRLPLGVLACACLVAALAGPLLALGLGLTAAQTFDAYVVTDAAYALALTAAGTLIAWHRPGHRVGRLLLASAAGYAVSTLAFPGILAADRAGWPSWAVTAVATVALAAWTPAIGVLLPVLLLRFPTGELPGPGWRWVEGATVATAPAFTLAMADPGGIVLAGRRYVSALVLPGYADLEPLWTGVGLRGSATVLVGAAALTTRWRRGPDAVRRQVLWLLLAVGAVLAALVLPVHDGRTGVVSVLAGVLLPIAVAVAVVRHNVLDVRLVVVRAIGYGLLTAATMAVYLTVAAGLGALVAGSTTTTGAALAAAVAALAVTPLRLRVLAGVERRFYGERHDQREALARLAPHLIAGRDGLHDALATVARTLRLPYAALRDPGGAALVEWGTPPAVVEVLALAGGELVVGVRRGQGALSPDDRRALEALAAPVAVALRATRLTEELQHSREEVVIAREEERRRLRRDLHDGLGPALAGISFTAGAALNRLQARPSDPGTAAALLEQLRDDALGSVTTVRGIVEGLRPAALDDHGLVDAIRFEARRLAATTRHAERGPLEIDVVCEPGDAQAFAELPAAVELSAYRIVVEALTNVARHSRAAQARVTLRLAEELSLEVEDTVHETAPRTQESGAGTTEPGAVPGHTWTPGVGLASMLERAREVGGRLYADATPTGGLVTASLPLAVR